MTGAEIRRARQAAGLRQLDVARKVGVTRSAVSRWERGLDEPSPDRLAALTALLAPTAC
jgi:transcriptional regulator with XRE-family HTH domain